MDNLIVALLASSVFKEILEDMVDRGDRQAAEAAEAAVDETVGIGVLHLHRPQHQAHTEMIQRKEQHKLQQMH